jgi:hypothetical protein
MSFVLKAISVIGMSGLKFVAGPVLAIATYKFNFFQSLLFTVIGGVVGVFVFVLLSEQILKLFRRMFAKKIRVKKVFTWKNKMIVKTVRSFGLFGLAAITPAVLSIPLGVFLAVRYFSNRRQIITYFSISVICWSLIFSSVLTLMQS